MRFEFVRVCVYVSARLHLFDRKKIHAATIFSKKEPSYGQPPPREGVLSSVAHHAAVLVNVVPYSD